MTAIRELSPVEVIQAKLAGIPADRPGLLAEYPRMMYRKGTPAPGTHDLAINDKGGVAYLPIQGHDGIETKTVANEDEELEAAEAGWHTTVTAAAEAKKGPKAPA